MLRYLTLLAFVLALFCHEVRADSVRLPLDRTDKARTEAGRLQFRGAVVIPPDKDRVGGLSALWVQGMQSVLALSDSGRLYRLDLGWSPEGFLIEAKSTKLSGLKDEDGSLVSGKTRGDSESLTRLADGSWLVGFERDHRIEHYADQAGVPSGAPVLWPAPSDLKKLPANEGLEAITVVQGNGVLALGEYVDSSGLSPAWIWSASAGWGKRSYRPQSGFAPVDAALLPSGDVLVLERSLSLFFGFRTRVALVPQSALAGALPLEGQTLALLQSPMITENFEGLAILPQHGGKNLLFIVSDNNMNTSQQTILAVFELKP